MKSFPATVCLCVWLSLAAAPVRPCCHAQESRAWSHVPVNIHFGQTDGDLTDAQIDFLSGHADIVTLEKGHGAGVHGSTERGIAETARRIKARNPHVKVLFYFNTFINWPRYESFESYNPEWTLRGPTGEILTHRSGRPRPDLSNPAFREWWSDVVAREMRRGPVDGLFADALAQALQPGLARTLGGAKARAVATGLEEMMVLTKRKIGPDKIILANGTRGVENRGLLDWPGVDGIMIEHFDAFSSRQPEQLKADLDTMELAAQRGKLVSLKGWPGFTWMDDETMKRPKAELLAVARDRITFPLACFLVAAQPGGYFCYSWGYRESHGTLDPYPELRRPLGPPKSAATWNGLQATREFEHVSVWVDLETKRARLDWRD
jgi:hypothetical protein